MKFKINKDHFLYFVMLVFIFISTSALSLSKITFQNIQERYEIKMITKNMPKNPILKNETISFPVFSAQGVIATDINSGVTLYEKNPDTSLYPASTTKIITALVALDTYSLDQVLTVPTGTKVEGQKMGLYVGERMKVEDLLYGLLVYSANDAAMTLALNHPSGYEAFIAKMNQKASELSMVNSHFDNPVGLDEISQTTTAKDLLRVSEVAMRNPIFSKIVGTNSIVVTDVTGKSKYNLTNINELLGKVPGVMGVKTGWTENARENLVTYFERDGHKLVIVILGSQDRFGETKELINWIFSNYEWKEVSAPQFISRILN